MTNALSALQQKRRNTRPRADKKVKWFLQGGMVKSYAVLLFLCLFGNVEKFTTTLPLTGGVELFRALCAFLLCVISSLGRTYESRHKKSRQRGNFVLSLKIREEE